MYKLVVSDLDGTLLGPDHRLGDYTRSVLARLRTAGVELILASGRHFMDVRALSAQLGSDGCLITCNGAAVNDGQGRLMQSRCIDQATVDFLLRDPLFASVHTNVFLTNAWLVEQPEPDLLRYHQDSGFHYQVVDFSALGELDVLKVFFFGEHEHLMNWRRPSWNAPAPDSALRSRYRRRWRSWLAASLRALRWAYCWSNRD